MPRFLSLVWLLVLAGSIPPTLDVGAAEIPLHGHQFTLPDGFEIELVAGPPLVERPITAAFDEQGRLYVADSSGSNDPVGVQLEQKPHRIVRLEDLDRDGRFDRSTVFADRMMFPEGTLWYAGSLYVAAPPSIWRLTDTDGDGKADERIEWFEGKTLTGCANDLHGPYLGPDGWIYWCKGAFAEQTYERPGQAPLVTRAAHIFRCRPDGTGIEPVMTGGMDNPVDVVFTSGGERIFTTTFLQHPEGGFRDGLIHAIYGGVYGKVHEVIENHPRTHPDVMPVLAHLGPAAPSGLACYESSVFGAEYQGNLFAALFNMQKVTRHVLEPDGGTFRSRDEDFLVSNNRDFHPTDVFEDADGSLIVVDTGGWYKLCCPTSQLVKPDVLGAIYRVRRSGAPSPSDPRGLQLVWDRCPANELAERLADARPAVRQRARQMLAARGSESVAALREVVSGSASPIARREAVWASTPIDAPEAREVARLALDDSDLAVRQAALHSVSVRRDQAALPQLLEQLVAAPPAVQRVAAEAIGRVGQHSAVPALLATLSASHDRVVEHSLTYALIEIADPLRTAEGLRSPSASVRRAALIALDQMGQGALTAEHVLPALQSEDERQREVAHWIAGRHPEWGAELAEFLRQQIDKPLSRELLGSRAEQLAGFARSHAVQELITELLRDPQASSSAKQLALEAVARARLGEAPTEWVEAIVPILENARELELLASAVAALRTLSVSQQFAVPLEHSLETIAAQPQWPVSLRLEALAAVPGGVAPNESLLTFLLEQLDTSLPVSTRAAAVDVLGRARLTTEQQLALADALARVGPLELDRLLSIFESSSDPELGKRLIAALRASPARSTLNVEQLRTQLDRFGPTLAPAAEQLYQELQASNAEQQQRLEDLLDRLSEGDVRRGQAVFNSSKAACSACHAIGYLGGRTGPDLTRIGRIRSERDLLEAIVFPSVSLVRSFEPVAVVTTDGKVLNGLLQKDAPDEVLLITGANQETRIPRDTIEAIRPSSVSIMPAGLDQQLSEQELADLVAFLKACQ